MQTTQRTGIAPLLALVALVLVAVGLLPGCGSRPETAEALLLRIAELNSQGKTKAIWGLMTDEARDGFRETVDKLKVFVERNPDPKNEGLITKQFNCTVKEFYTLPVIEIFERENQGNERVLEGVRLVDQFPDPEDPRNTIVVWESDATIRPQQMVCRQVDDGTWLLIRLRKI